MKIKFSVFFLVIIILCAVGGYFSRQYYAYCQKTAQEQRLYDLRKAAWQKLQLRIESEISAFEGEAGIVIKDLSAGWEFSYEKTRRFPSASLAKVPILAACFLAADQGKLNLGETITLKSTDKLSGSGILKNMPAGTTFSVERLLGLMIYDSDNTAANIVTSLTGISYLNSAFKNFGLKNTDLSRKIADYQSRDKGIENYTTAEDMALLLEKMHRRELGNKYVSEQCIGILKLARTNDRIPKYLPVDLTIAHKTGLENGICHDMGIVFTKKGAILICVLTKHAYSTSVRAKEFIAAVALHAYSYLESAEKLIRP
ncbi:MAG: serine hydrolase [Candidatus Omnitrophota bacterium]